MKNRLLLIVLLTLTSTLSWGQYDFSRSVGASVDNTDTTCVTAPLGATCVGFPVSGWLRTVAPTFEGNLWGCQNNTIWHRKVIPSTSWTTIAGACLDSDGSIAAASDNANEVAVISTDHYIYTRTNGSWQVLGGSNVQADYIASGTDFDLWIKDHLSGHAKQWNGTSWGVRSTTFIPDELCVGDSSHVYSVSAGSLYKWNGSAWALITGTPASLQHCAVQWNMGIFVIASPDKIYHQANFTGSWHRLATEAHQGYASWRIHCSTYNNCYLTDMTVPPGQNNIFHLNQGNFTLTTNVSGSYTNFCAALPNGCPVGSSHSGSNRVTFQSGTNGNLATFTNVTPQTVVSTFSTGSPNPACDLFFLPGDARCIPSEPKTVSCSMMGALAIANKPKSDVSIVSCYSHPISPVGAADGVPPFSWKTGVTVTVYFDPLPGQFTSSDSRIDAICAGFNKWTPINGVHYTCDRNHISTPIASTPKPWHFVTTDNSTTTSFSSPCANVLVAGICPGMLSGQHRWQMNTASTIFGTNTNPTGANLTKRAAHEQGHFNFLDDCPNCVDGNIIGVKESIMYTPIDPTGGNLPIGPTDCDEIWYNIWYRAFAH